ncbi:HpsJ family protein [Kovacikia minuta CCNUW1]|uniref:HpsJ family protein n=1 Tax=Kovacikia minuta TaxID=2931930 RepID=UPI001CCE9E27|nr:HpsJ family protein [Kovacikia minuta]UBF27877.1 HpsJ family protein [Kovacikia minuta CCNUW1]
MKAFSLSPLTSLILKLVGIVLISTYLIDLIVYLITADFQNSQWVLNLTTQLVDRGFIPLVGLAILFTGFWVESNSDPATSGSSRGLRLTALWLASVLGLAFLLIAPWHFSTTRSAADDQIKKAEQNAASQQAQLDAQVQQLRAQVDAQANAADQAIKAGQLQGEELVRAKQLQKLKSDPKALEAQIAPARDQKQKEIQTQKQQIVDQTRKGALQTGLRICLNSLLLAFGYATIGWVGLRQLFNLQEPRGS